jgi:hypothetical protein
LARGRSSNPGLILALAIRILVLAWRSGKLCWQAKRGWPIGVGLVISSEAYVSPSNTAGVVGRGGRMAGGRGGTG